MLLTNDAADAFALWTLALFRVAILVLRAEQVDFQVEQALHGVPIVHRGRQVGSPHATIAKLVKKLGPEVVPGPLQAG